MKKITVILLILFGCTGEEGEVKTGHSFFITNASLEEVRLVGICNDSGSVDRPYDYDTLGVDTLVNVKINPGDTLLIVSETYTLPPYLPVFSLKTEMCESLYVWKKGVLVASFYNYNKFNIPYDSLSVDFYKTASFYRYSFPPLWHFFNKEFIGSKEVFQYIYTIK